MNPAPGTETASRPALDIGEDPDLSEGPGTETVSARPGPWFEASPAATLIVEACTTPEGPDARIRATNRAFRRLYGEVDRRLSTFLCALGRQAEPRTARFLDTRHEPPRALLFEAAPLEPEGSTWVCTLRPETPDALGDSDDTERQRSGRIHKIQSQVLESMSEGVALSTPAGFVLYTNPALDAMFGLAPGELIGQPLDRLGPTDRPDLLQRRGADLGRGGRWSGDLEQRSADGREIVTHVELSALDIDGAVHWVAVFEDVTAVHRAEVETRRFEERLGRAQKLESLAVMAGGIAHDFNNLLMVVLGNASLAIDDLSDDSFEATPLRREALRADLRQVESAALRAAALTEQMLAYSGRGQFVLEPVDLSALIGSMRELLESSSAKGVDLSLHLQPGTTPIEADLEQIRQLIVNLVANAAEAMPHGGTVRVASTERHCTVEQLHDASVTEPLPAGRYLVLTVADDGCGMDDTVRERVFDPFFTTKFTGRGLGMAAVQGIVRGHGGGIRVDSAPGRGTRVTVFLPIAVEPATSRAPSTVLDPVGGKTVLIVDDESEVRRTGRRMLERLGFRVVEAEDGRTALDTFRRDPDAIDLVLLDWSMPGLDGEATLRGLRALRETVPVVVSTGWAIGDLRLDEQQPESAPPVGYLQKPYQPNALLEAIERGLAGRVAARDRVASPTS